MSYHHHHSHIPFLLLLLFSIGLSFEASAQDTIAGCGPSLLPLASCGPFVQGNAAHPAQSCCHGLDQLHSQRPGCICLLLHDSNLLFAFPINTKLALQLPAICHLGFDVSTCRGAISLPSLAPPARASFVPIPNSSVVSASSPMVTMTHRPNFKGIGLHQSAEVSLKAKHHMSKLMLMLIVAVACIMPAHHARI
ncbi:lipid-transfer protein [Striga asiatica]|uniref:Lipid-transfer protein n=1 Tax=Striga asiatica TaxID=4170 RepID=A0A5A7Q0J4_STRAF|nr:lipid-transfer protein [Striga asiatica]